MKKQNSNQNVKVQKMAVLVKTFDHCHYKFQLFQLSCKIVKEFETIQFSDKKNPGGKTTNFSFKIFPIMRSVRSSKY